MHGMKIFRGIGLEFKSQQIASQQTIINDWDVEAN